MVILSDKKRELLSARLTELGNYTIASLFISQFLAEKTFDFFASIGAIIAGILLSIAGLLIAR